MSHRISMCLSFTALVVAIGGATPIGEAGWNQLVPRNSVGTLQLKRNAVTSSKLAPNAVRTGQIVDGSLLSVDFKAGQIPQGPKGDKGDRGDRGASGPVGVSGYEIVAVSKVVSANAALLLQARCPAGKKVLGGTEGAQGFGVFFSSLITGSASGLNDTYTVDISNTKASARMVFVRATCARVA